MHGNVIDSEEVYLSKGVKRTAVLSWLGWVFDFYDLILIVFLLPLIEHDIGFTPAQSAWLVGIGLGASGLGGILFGWLSDLYGRKKILTATVLLFSLGMLTSGLVQTPLQFFIARFVTGLGLGGEWAVGHALIAESVPAEKRGRWSAWLQSGEPVGVALAAFMGFLVAPQIGWRSLFCYSALTGLLALAFRGFLQESPLWIHSPKTSSKVRFQALWIFLKAFWPLMAVAWLLAVFKLGTYWTCYTWLPRFIQQSYGVALGKSALWIIMGQVGQFLGMLWFGKLADTLGRRWAFTLFSSLTALSLLPLAFAWDHLFNQLTALFWILIFTLGVGAGCTAGFGALLSELFPTAQRTFAMGSVYSLARGAQVIAPTVVLWAAQQNGIEGALLVPTTLALLTAAWVWALPERYGEPLPHEPIA